MRGRTGAGMGILAALFIVLSIPCTARSEPFMAVREGFKCSQCHANITGGGKRNDFGNIYAQTRLPLWFLRASEIMKEDEGIKKYLEELKDLVPGAPSLGAGKRETGDFFTTRVSDYLAFGGNLRARNRTTLVPGESEGVKDENALEVSEGVLFAEVDLIPSRLMLYLDESVAPGTAQAREAFGLVYGLPFSSYVKAGKFFLPYGLRLQDDTAFVRQFTGYSYSTPDIGVEIGLEPGPLSLALAFSNGTQGASEDNLDKQITASAALIFSIWRAGVSGSYNIGPGGAKRSAAGLHAGVHVGRFTLLGEVDLVHDKGPESGSRDSMPSLVEADVLLLKGLNLKFAYEFYNPNLDVREDERERWTLGLEPFITQFLQTRLLLRINEGIPQNLRQNSREVLLEVHAFF